MRAEPNPYDRPSSARVRRRHARRLAGRLVAALALASSAAGCPSPPAPRPGPTTPAPAGPARPAAIDAQSVGILDFTLLRPVVLTLRRSPALAPELRARLANVELETLPDVTLFPTAEAVSTGTGGAIEIDAAYFWHHYEAFWLAALAELLPRAAERVERATVSLYQRACEEAVGAGEAVPRIRLPIGVENRNFGAFDQAFDIMQPATREALRTQSTLVAQTFLAFTVLHELGHIALRHDRGATTPERSRALEAAADGFAFEHALALGYPLSTLRDALGVEALAQDTCAASGYVFPRSHPRWRERQRALEEFMRENPPAGEWVVLRGWWQDRTRDDALIPVTIEMLRAPGAGGRRYATVWLGTAPLEAVPGTDGRHEALRFRAVDGLHAIVLVGAPGHQVSALWEVVEDGVLVRQSEVVLRHAPLDVGQPLFDVLVSARRLATPEARAQRALAVAGATEQERARVLLLVLDEQAALAALLEEYVAGRVDEPAYDERRRTIRDRARAAMRQALGEDRYARYHADYVSAS